MAEPNNIRKSVELPVCRICFQCEPDDLIEPCDCQGITSKVHKNCLEFSLIGLDSLRCEICSFHYNIEMIPKYKLCESIRVWAKERSSLLDYRKLFWIILYFLVALLYEVTWLTRIETDFFEDDFWYYWWIIVFVYYVISATYFIIIFYSDWAFWDMSQMKISVIPGANIRNSREFINPQNEAEINV